MPRETAAVSVDAESLWDAVDEQLLEGNCVQVS